MSGKQADTDAGAGTLVDLGDVRRSKAAARCFARWKQRLGLQPGPDATLADLPDKVLANLAELDRQATLALYDLVLGARDWGPGEKFETLEPALRMDALDVYLFLADQVRFEVMRRLGWLESPAAEPAPMVEMALDHRRFLALGGTPRLSSSYPRYGDVAKRLTQEPEAVIRSLIPEAMTVFRRKAGL